MNKKERIITSAMKLFAEKGYFSTSIQEIADLSNVSKGSVYSYFQSKEDLLLSIFQYYYDTMNGRVIAVAPSKESEPIAHFKTQLVVFLEETVHLKEFIMMQFRQNILSINDDLKKIIQKINMEMHEWFKQNLLAVYGEEIKPYIEDSTLIVQGLLHAYLRSLIIHELKVDLQKLATFILQRTDDLVQGMIRRKEAPMVSPDMAKTIFKKQKENQTQQVILSLLNKMEKTISTLDLPLEKKEQFIETVDFLKIELHKEPMKKFIFQGMLLNFKGIKELNPEVEQIANHLQIQL